MYNPVVYSWTTKFVFPIFSPLFFFFFFCFFLRLLKKDGTKRALEMFLNVLINPACNNNSPRYYYIIKFIRHGLSILLPLFFNALPRGIFIIIISCLLSLSLSYRRAEDGFRRSLTLWAVLFFFMFIVDLSSERRADGRRRVRHDALVTWNSTVTEINQLALVHKTN